jgi:hypothetical protein
MSNSCQPNRGNLQHRRVGRLLLKKAEAIAHAGLPTPFVPMPSILPQKLERPMQNADSSRLPA